MSADSTVVVVNRPGELPPEVGGAKVLTARSYLSDDVPFAQGTRVINLCRYDRYQSDGYYVSLLAGGPRSRVVARDAAPGRPARRCAVDA
jgi:hypothetical protein